MKESTQKINFNNISKNKTEKNGDQLQQLFEESKTKTQLKDKQDKIRSYLRKPEVKSLGLDSHFTTAMTNLNVDKGIQHKNLRLL